MARAGPAPARGRAGGRRARRNQARRVCTRRGRRVARRGWHRRPRRDIGLVVRAASGALGRGRRDRRPCARHRPRLVAIGCGAGGGASRAHPLRRTRGCRRAPPRLGAADARARATARRRPARGRATRAHAGARAARLAAAGDDPTSGANRPQRQRQRRRVLGAALDDAAALVEPTRRAGRGGARARLPARRPRAAAARGHGRRW